MFAEVNQRILEDLQLKKQQLQKGGASTATTSSVVIPGYMQMSTVSDPNPVAPVSVATNQQSFGYFIPQDSAFGNTILPVLPRYETTK